MALWGKHLTDVLGGYGFVWTQPTTLPSATPDHLAEWFNLVTPTLLGSQFSVFHVRHAALGRRKDEVYVGHGNRRLRMGARTKIPKASSAIPIAVNVDLKIFSVSGLSLYSANRSESVFSVILDA
jgi:hypothetical protein